MGDEETASDWLKLQSGKPVELVVLLKFDWFNLHLCQGDSMNSGALVILTFLQVLT